MIDKNHSITQTFVENQILTIRGLQVMLDRDLAQLYQVETRVLNQAVRRNIDRFPKEFRFQLTSSEFENWKSQIVISKEDKQGLRKSPFAFTEQGVAMLSAILRSETAVKISIQIMHAFVKMRKLISDHQGIFQRLTGLEYKQIETEKKFEIIFNALQQKNTKPTQGIFFNGQIFDAYKFIADLIRKADVSITLIDNYIDDTVLTLFRKRKKNVTVIIFTKSISKQFSLDLAKFNAQYEPIIIEEFRDAHDRFLIIDDKELYHIGASLKDLGKKWFAFSKMDICLIDKLRLKKINVF